MRMRDEKGGQLEIEFFFRTYKVLEQLETEILGWGSATAAREIIDAARDRLPGRSPNQQRS